MRHRCRVSWAVASLTVAMIGLAGCSFGRQPPTRLYVLTALPATEAVPAGGATHRLAVVVGPVELPQYADRPQVVTGNTSNELHSAALAQWAEPLADNFARVLAENLSLLLGTDRVAVFPWRGPLPMEYQVMVEVTRFLGEPGGEVSLVALWSVVGKNGKEVVASKKSSFSEPTRAQDYEALAAAMSRTVAALSRDIATAIATDSQKVSSR
jgi:uncharacterized protein